MKRKTLFDPNLLIRELDYANEIRQLFEKDDAAFGGSELSAFDDVVGFERQFSFKDIGSVAGPLRFKIGSKKFDASKCGNMGVPIPTWPEPEVVEFLNSGTRGVLLVEKSSFFSRLKHRNADKTLNIILTHAIGLPRFSTRRFYHRICREFRIPLFILADNDTWGYFMFSVMKRGLIDPSKEFPLAAVKDTRFLGMRCKDAAHFENPKEAKIPGKSYWKYRIAALRKYACFKSNAWQREFDAFEKQKGKFELDALVGRKGIDYVIHEYLKPKLEQRDYLN